jgi:hypothetical protein
VEKEAVMMTRKEAIERLASASEDDEDLPDEAEELFAAIYGREPDVDDGDAGELISLCYADPDVAAAVKADWVDEDGDCVECGHPANNSSGHGTCAAPGHRG